MSKILEEANKIKGEIIDHRRHLHANPEVFDDLPNTTKYVREVLESYGYEVNEICKSGLVALAGDPSKGKTIMLRADMDALPMQELSNLPFSSTNNYAHTCGHDMHTSMLLGVAKILKERESELNGCVKLMFQPDEEGLTGAKKMLKAGLLENPKVDAAAAIHVMSGMECGVVSYRTGSVMASQDRFQININGKGGHGAYPQDTIDPINVGVHIHLALQEIIARETAAQDPLVITVGMFKGGDVANIIPHTAVMEGTIRSLDPDVRTFAKRRLEEVSMNVAKTYRAEANTVWLAETPVNFNNEELTNELITYIQNEGITTVEMPQGMGSEDFAFVSEQVPSAYFALGAGGEDACYHQGGMHHPKVIFNEDCLPVGVSVFVSSAISWLNNN